MTLSLMDSLSIGMVLSVVLSLLTMITDIRARIIPNRLLLIGMILGSLVYVGTGAWDEMGHGILSMGLALLFLLPFYFLGGLGAGDVKLLAVIGWLVSSPWVWFSIFFWTAITGGILSFLFILFHPKRISSWNNFLHSIRTLLYLKELPIVDEKNSITLPYGIPIFLGVLIVGVFGPLSM